MKTIRIISAGLLILAVLLLLPMSIGVWTPDIVYAKRHVIAHAETASGHKFDVIQYWNRSDFYTTELIHTDSEGRQQSFVLDGDDDKSWSVPLTVDEAHHQVTVVLSGDRPRTVDYIEERFIAYEHRDNIGHNKASQVTSQ